MQKTDAKQLYIDTYLQVLDYMIKHSSSDSMNGRDLHRQAAKIARYKVFVTTGINITTLDVGKQKHELYRRVGRAHNKKTLGSEIERILRMAVPRYGNQTSMLAQTLATEMRRDLQSISPNLRAGILRVAGLDGDRRLRTVGNVGVDLVRDPIRIGDYSLMHSLEPMLKDIKHAEHQEQIKNARLHREKGIYIPNLAFFQEMRRQQMGRSHSGPLGMVFNHVDMTEYNPQQEHTLIQHILGIYEDDPYSKKALKYRDKEVIDPFGRIVTEHRLDQEARNGIYGTPFHEFEERLRDKIFAEDSPYLSESVFYDIFKRPFEAHEQQRARLSARVNELIEPYETQRIAFMADLTNIIGPVNDHGLPITSEMIDTWIGRRVEELYPIPKKAKKKRVEAILEQRRLASQELRKTIRPLYRVYESRLKDLQAATVALRTHNSMDPDVFRSAVLTAKNVADSYLAAVRRDIDTLESMRDLLQRAQKQKISLITYLADPKNTKKSPFAHTDFAKHVLANVPGGAKATDEAVLIEMSHYIRNKLFIPLPMLEYDSKNIRNMLSALNLRITQAYDRTNTTYYRKANIYRQFFDDFREMRDSLKDRGGVLSNAYQGYTDFGIEQKPKNGLLEEEEREALYAHTTEGLKEQEFADEVAKRNMSHGEAERVSSGRQRIRNALLAQMERANSKRGQAMQEFLINTIESNAASLKGLNKKDFIEKLYGYLVLPSDSPFRGLTREGLTGIVEAYGIDPANPAGVRARIDEFMRERNQEGSMFQIMEDRTHATSSRIEEFRDAYFREIPITVPGRVGHHRITGIDGTTVSLEAEHILAEGIRLNLDIDASDIDRILDEMTDQRLLQIQERHFRHQEAQRTIHNSVVEVRYQHMAVNESIKESNEQMFERLLFYDKKMGKLPGEMHDTVIPTRNLIEGYNKFMARIDDGTNDVMARLPYFMRDIIEQKLPYMMEYGRGNELASMAYMALQDAIFSLHEDRTLDLSDNGFVRRFMLEDNMTREEAEKKLEELKGRGRKTRLDMFLEDRIRNRMYQQFYKRFSDSERRQAGESVVIDTLRMLQDRYAATGNREYEPTPGNVRAFIHKIGDELGIQPFYREAMQFSEAQIGLIIEDELKGLRKPVSYEELYERLIDAHQQEIDARFESLEKRLEQDDLPKEDLDLAREQYNAMMDRIHNSIVDAGDEGTEKVLRERILSDADWVTGRLRNFEVTDYNKLIFGYEAALIKNPHLTHVEAQVPFQGKMYDAIISRASGGGFIAYVPSLNRNIPIYRNAQEAKLQKQVHEFTVRPAYDGKVVEDITNSGGVRRRHIGDYDSIQRRGSHLTAANPSDTFGLIKEVMEGKRNLVYLDMETTGLTGSTIPEHLVQPLEVYMREGQYSPAKGDFYTSRGDVMVREDGRNVAKTLHAFIQPSDEVIDFTRQLMTLQAKDFVMPVNFRAANGGWMTENISVLDLLRMRANEEDPATYTNFLKRLMQDPEGVAKARRAQEMVDQIFFMRNIAKYALEPTRVKMHTGALDADLDVDLGDFLSTLHQDVETALRNFEIDPDTGDLRLFTGRPELRGAQRMTPEQLVAAYLDFTKDAVIAGQNVSEADVKKIFMLADNYIDAERANLLSFRGHVIDALQTAHNTFYDPLKGDKLLGGFEGVVQIPSDRRYRKLETMVRNAYGSVKAGGFVNEPYVVLPDPEDPNRKYALLTQNAVNQIYDGKFQVATGIDAEGNAILRTLDPGDIMLLEDLYDDNESFVRAVHEIRDRYHGGEEKALAQYIDPNVGLGSMYVMPYDLVTKSDPRQITHKEWRDMTAEEFDALPEDLRARYLAEGTIVPIEMSQEGRINAAISEYERIRGVNPKVTINGVLIGDYLKQFRQNQEFIDTLRNASDEEFLKLAREHNLLDFRDYDEAVNLRNSIPKPDVIEEMFVAGYVLPGLRRRRAEDIQKALDIAVPDEQHLAKTDVRMGFDVFRELFRRLRKDPEFQAYQDELLQPGDVVFHHAAVDRSLPLGVYQVHSIDNAASTITFREYGRDNSPIYTLRADNLHDLDRKFQLHFNYVEPDNVESVLNEFREDNARRQLQRATQGAFQFDLYQGELTGNTSEALNRLLAYRTAMADEGGVFTPGSGFQGLVNPDSQIPIETQFEMMGLSEEARKALEPIMNRVAYDSESLFRRPDFEKLATPNITPAKQAAFDLTAAFFDSEEGKARYAFMSELRAMETFNIVPKTVGRDLIRQMNESIIAEGKRRGYVRTPANVVHAGIMDDRFGPELAGSPMTLDLTNTRTLNQSLFSYAQRLRNEADDLVQNPDGLFITEGNLKSTALNEIIFPFLRQQGLLEYGDEGISVSEAIRQLMSREVVGPDVTPKAGQLKQFQEYDYLGFTRHSQDQGFIDFIRAKHDELLGPLREIMTPVQQDLVKRQMEQIEMLKQYGLFHPNMTIKPEIDLKKFPLTTVDFTNNFGSISQVDSLTLEQKLKEIEGSRIVEDVKLRRGIMNTLFQRVTAGRPNSLEGLFMENMYDSDRMEAARILGYVKKIDDNRRAALEQELASIDPLSLRGEQIQKFLRSGYEINENIGEIYFGDTIRRRNNANPLQFADERIQALPEDLIENILNRSYTESSGHSFMQGLLWQYVQQGKPGFVGPKQIPREYIPSTANVTEEMLAEAGVQDPPSHLREMVELRKKQGEAKARERSIYKTDNLDDLVRERPPSDIERFASRVREGVGEMVESIFGGDGPLRAGGPVRTSLKWIAGLGIAAYALKQFASNGGPLKFEHRPQGHGVEGIGGTGDNDDMDRKETPPVGDGVAMTGNKSYVATHGSNGYTVRARAKNTKGIEQADILSGLQQGLGNMNINLRDDRETMDRAWLEQQMDQYLSRGHLG